MDTTLVQILAQIIIAIIGISGPIILEIIKLQKTQPPNPTVIQPPGTNVTPLKNQLIKFSHKNYLSFLDLSIIFLCGAFFSTVIADSMLVSGQAPTLSILGLFLIFLIAFLTTLALVLAWYWGRAEFVVGIMSITTLLILIISPGGLLNYISQKGGEEIGINLIFPVFVLVLIATASIIYYFGNPLTKGISPRIRRQILLFIIALISISSLILGQQFVLDVEQDKLTPKFIDVKEKPEEIKQAQEVLARVVSKNLQERGLLYRLGSEIALSPYYRDFYFQVLASKSNGNQLASPTITPTPSPTNNPSNISERMRFLNSLVQSFSGYITLPYLRDRLLWTHPTAHDGNGQLSLPLPGIDAKSRLESLAKYRIIYAMNGQRNSLDNFFRLFTYDDEIIRVFDWKDRYEDKFFLKKKTYPLQELPEKTWANLFPELPLEPYKNDLLQELALPISDEAFIAYSIYKKLAPSLQPENQDLLQYFSKLDNLKIATQRAFIKYIADADVGITNHQKNEIVNILTEIAKNNTAIPGLDNYPSAARDLATLIAPDPNKEKTAISNENLKNLSSIINQRLNAENKKRLANFLRKEDPNIPIRNLINQETFDFLKIIDRDLTETKRNTLFDILRDPVTPAIEHLVENVPPYKTDKKDNWLKNQLDNFIKLNPENREAILHHLAIATYRAEGEYSLAPIKQIIFQANSLSYWLALVCATILMLPIILSAIFLGGFWGFKLIERDRIRDLIAAERFNQESLDNSHTLGIPVELQGRYDFLERLRNLSGRGWSTIAVVGRRGVGKSRVLYELYKSTSGIAPDYGVRVWMSAPSQYAEEDFIESTLEQLALNTEKVIARYLGAEPFVVRQLEELLTRSGLIVFVIGILILVIMLGIIYNRLSRLEVMITWFPILLVVVASFGCIFIYLTRLQPLDLTPWLESDRTHSPHTVLLYRRVQDVFKYIHARKTTLMPQSTQITLIRAIIAIFGGILIGSVTSSLISLIIKDATILMILFIAISFLSGIIIYRETNKNKRDSQTTRGASLMSLIAEYRSFATNIVYRLEQGALGDKIDHGSNVMICIDELDKIIELSELRQFLRRMKGIFEVPGVYYYLSLSEDALAALYLGTADGKNEVDSSLDHIVRIPPLYWEQSKEVAIAYLHRRQAPQFDVKILDSLVTISFGIPRDVLRLCDQLMAKKDAIAITPKQCIYQIRKDQVEIAAEVHEWTKQHCDYMLKEAVQSARYVKQTLEDLAKQNPLKLRECRILLLIWILCGVEFANDLEDKQRQAFLQELYNLGYRITLSQAFDLVNEMNKLDVSFLPQVP